MGERIYVYGEDLRYVKSLVNRYRKVRALVTYLFNNEFKKHECVFEWRIVYRREKIYCFECPKKEKEIKTIYFELKCDHMRLVIPRIRILWVEPLEPRSLQ